MSTYTDNIPQPTDIISVSQGQILDNFSQLDTSFGIDHTAFSVGTNIGYHKKVTLQAPLGSDPGKASPIADLYTKTVAGASQLFFQNGALAANVSQLTGNLTSGTSGGNTHYTVVTPWGIIFTFGLCNTSQGGTANTFATAFPTAGLGIIITCRHGAGAISSSYANLTSTGFTGYNQSGAGSQTSAFFAWGN